MNKNILSTDLRIELIKAAIKAASYAYAPFSNFKVGAALLTESGEIYSGCNIENSSFGATICAERTAIVKAVSEGYRSFTAIAIVSVSESSTASGSVADLGSAVDSEVLLVNQLTFPCGICRQFMYEFMPNAQVIVSDLDFNYKVYSVSDLLPHGFRL